eukprot:CAMPEP_0184745922 /NCGR_PEP_ID=MMETSP0315-20130426/8553_1 /TAXON_ID=101924 /ORGANISM="Rhodosorus marinus, Strain UTEX LB 2760" /LENGTH=793 /DNA_ID=CAMNT_0027218295 /DNA_START=129 /DNA_END=2510 /DNA_ORIENTATION=+
MGLTQSSAGLMRSMSPYAAESPTRDFLGGSMMYGSTPRAFWGELFGEYYFLRTSPNVPQSLLQSLQSATKALTRAFARPDHVDAHNVSMMFRVVVSFASEYSESMEREFVQGQSAILSDSSSGNGFQITEQHVCGGVMLLADVVNAFISSGAGRDRIYLVLGASARRERAGGDGHLLAGGEAVARSTVEALCGILVTVDRSPIERMIPVKQLITHALVTVLSARLYADRSITSESVAFLPFFELWGRKNSNAHNLVQTLLRNAAVTNSADTLYEQNSPSSSGPATPTSWSSAVVDINNYMGISQTVPASSSQSFGRFLRRKSQRNSFRPQQTMTESASSLRSDPGLWINSPRTGRTPIGGSRTGTRPQLAKSSISMLVVLLFGSDQERSELFTAAVLEMSESEDKRHEVFEVAIKWIGDDRGILLTYLLLQKCNAFRRMAPGLLLDGVDSSPLFDVLKLITNERGSNEPPEVVFVPLILLELLTEDPEMLQSLEEVKLPTLCLHDNLSICSPEEAMSCSEDEDRSSVPLGIVVVLAAVSSARRKRTDTFLLTLSVTIIANISRTALRVVDHASWSIITLLDSLSSQYRSYSVQEPSSDTEDEEGTSGTWHEDTDDMTVVLGTMVEAVAALVLGTARVHESIYVKNEHVLLGLLKIRESIFDVDSGLTLMIAKNEKASAECQAACKRLFQLLDEAKEQLSDQERSLEDEELLIQLREKLNLGKLHEQLEMEDLNGPEFRYVEERRALDFFAPYVWSIERGVSLDPPDPTMRFLAITPPTIRETLSSSVKSPLAP